MLPRVLRTSLRTVTPRGDSKGERTTASAQNDTSGAVSVRALQRRGREQTLARRWTLAVELTFTSPTTSLGALWGSRRSKLPRFFSERRRAFDRLGLLQRSALARSTVADYRCRR